MRRAAGCWALAACMAVAAPAWADEAGAPPLLELVRSISRVQDGIVAGDRDALALQSRLLSFADERIGAIPAADIHDEHTVKALISYGLSGGNPNTLDRQLQVLGEDDHMAVLGRGLVAYMRGQHEEALQDLAAFDAMTMDPEIGAPLALLQGSLYAHEHPDKALDHFDKARLLAPGTIVEESALRRSLAQHIRLHRTEDFLDTARRYAQRFVRSPYGEQFAVYFSNGVVDLHGSFDVERIAEVADVMPADYRRAIYVRIARQAALHGLTDLAAFATEHALPKDDAHDADNTASASAADKARLAFYDILSTITSSDPQEARTELDSVNTSLLPPEDLDLMAAGRAMVDALVKTSAIKADAGGQGSHRMDGVDGDTGPAAAGEAGGGPLVDEPQTAAQHAGQPADGPAAKHEDPASDDFAALDSQLADWRKKIEQADQALVESSK